MKLLKCLNKTSKLAELKFLIGNVIYATYKGSVAYSVANLCSETKEVVKIMAKYT